MSVTERYGFGHGSVYTFLSTTMSPITHSGYVIAVNDSIVCSYVSKVSGCLRWLILRIYTELHPETYLRNLRTASGNDLIYLHSSHSANIKDSTSNQGEQAIMKAALRLTQMQTSMCTKSNNRLEYCTDLRINCSPMITQWVRGGLTSYPSHQP